MHPRTISIRFVHCDQLLCAHQILRGIDIEKGPQLRVVPTQRLFGDGLDPVPAVDPLDFEFTLFQVRFVRRIRYERGNNKENRGTDQAGRFRCLVRKKR